MRFHGALWRQYRPTNAINVMRRSPFSSYIWDWLCLCLVHGLSEISTRHYFLLEIYNKIILIHFQLKHLEELSSLLISHLHRRILVCCFILRRLFWADHRGNAWTTTDKASRTAWRTLSFGNKLIRVRRSHSRPLTKLYDSMLLRAFRDVHNFDSTENWLTHLFTS